MAIINATLNIPDSAIPTTKEDNTVTKLQCVYEGDYMIGDNYIPSAVAALNGDFADIIVSIAAPSDSKATAAKSDDGLVICWSRKTNAFLYRKTIEVGHANGLCYDNKHSRWVIAPVFTFVNGTKQGRNQLIIYDKDFENVSYIKTPESIMGVSYCDPYVYAYAYSGKIYKLHDNIFTLVTTVKLPITLTFLINQGFAVKDNYFYLSQSRGVILKGDLESGEILSEYFVDNNDISGYRPLGELEDFEFSTDGTLYAQRCMRICGDTINATMVSIPLEHITTEPAQIMFTLTNNTFTISDATVAKVKNNNTELKHPCQMNFFVVRYPITRLTINCKTAFGKLVFYEPVVLDIKLLLCKQIEAHNGTVNIKTDNSHVALQFVDSSITKHLFATRNGSFSFSGTKSCNVTCASKTNFYLYRDCTEPLTFVQYVPIVNNGKGFTIDGKNLITAKGLYYGAKLIS